MAVRSDKDLAGSRGRSGQSMTYCFTMTFVPVRTRKKRKNRSAAVKEPPNPLVALERTRGEMLNTSAEWTHECQGSFPRCLHSEQWGRPVSDILLLCTTPDFR